MNSEIESIRQQYARRQLHLDPLLYDPLQASNYMTDAERRRAFIHWIYWAGLAPVQNKRVLEVGCGNGANLLQFLSLGFQPENLVGNDLLEDRVRKAKHLLPTQTQILVGDASALTLEPNSFDIVFQSTVFTSILNDSFQQKLASRMWTWAKPGGGILWYDFIFNNPNNPDVRGISPRRIQELFPIGEMKVWRLTLAPPISRRVTQIHPDLYTVFNFIPFLRTHVLCWLQKKQ